jgi:HlyD family secretion protein
LLQFDRKTEKPYVEVKTTEDKFEKRFLKLGTSDGVNVEVLSGITMDDSIKVWNKLTTTDDK